jgi:tol-pal system protein YbgF
MRKRIFIWLLFFANAALANDGEIYHLEQRVNELTDKVEQLTHQNSILQKKMDALASDVEFRMKAVESKPKAAKSEEKQEKVTKSKDPNQIKKQFDDAYSLLQGQKYEEAETAFSEFVASYPKSEYTGNAYYWLGETFMLRKRYDKAAVNYIMSFDKFPKNNKADLSMLKLSTALKNLGKKKEACATLAKLKAKKDKLSASMQKLLAKELSNSGCK